MQQLMHRVAEAVLDGILPRNAGERQALLQQTVVMLDQTVSTMPVHLQKEVKDLLGMLSIAPTRFLLGGRWAGWANASVADTTAFLTGLRTSRVELKRFIYVTLQELTTLSFYTLPQTWKLFGYPGPLLHGPGEEV
ncbi:MAG: hypothetical protein HY853_02640 [Burkholderiales bacterium]|nr:hypothetical protein [Burkholderiales bacterium]